MSYSDFLFRGNLDSVDPDVAELIRLETARQAQYLVMIPSESTIPAAVREAVGSSFNNIYAEGYPPEDMRQMSEAEILNYDMRMAEYRRDSDARYYKGAEYANLVESLARRRVAEAFATARYSADQLYVNVQPLSGAPANSAIYTALLTVGDTVMGLDLLDGGHLTHGSPVNRSGLQYKIVSYGVDPVTERLDYAKIRELALQHRPRMIIAGFTSYPLAPDFAAFRAIADEVGAYLLADIAHTAGMAITGDYPNPVGIADVVNFTTHKTLNGPRGAVSITHRADLYKKIDRAVFPGEQGGPHVNSIAGLAVAMKFSQTEQFHELQHRTAQNAVTLWKTLEGRGLRIPYGGTDTHMLLVDCKSITGADSATLSGDIAARLLDIVGIVANRNTIPGDKSAFAASGVRLGTAWISQRGFDASTTAELGNIIADVFYATTPYILEGKKGKALLRAKIDFDALQDAKCRVRDLISRIGIDTDVAAPGYPHFFYMEQENPSAGWQTLGVYGSFASEFLDNALTGKVIGLAEFETTPTYILEQDGDVMSRALIERTGDGYLLHVEENFQRVLAWLRALSDGFVQFDPTDIAAKLPGPVVVREWGASPEKVASLEWDISRAYVAKPYFIGMDGEALDNVPPIDPLPIFNWQAPFADGLKRTTLYDLHKALGAKTVEFAGYDMPVYYSSVANEHQAVRTRAGIFDVTHMGVFEAYGEGAAHFLNTVFTNLVNTLRIGSSEYGFLLDVNGNPFDDLMIYRLGEDHYLIVVNSANNDKDWAWLNAVKHGQVALDRDYPLVRYSAGDSFTLRDLRAASSGADQRVDVALQGPASKDLLVKLGGSPEDLSTLKGLAWAGVAPLTLGGFDLIVSRTGYTGERIAYELFVHPDRAAELFKTLVELGAEPCGLAARDSLRTEAGLPLYGHELAGDLDLKPGDAGMGNYVKHSKAFFVGKRPYLADESQRDAVVTRFKLDQKGGRPPHAGDPVLDARGRVIGVVTSCTPDSDGYQLGMVYIKETHAEEGTPVMIYCGGYKGGEAKPSVQLGERLPVPEAAHIISRFPVRKSTKK